MDQDHTPESRELLSEFEGSGRFIIAGEPDSERAMQDLLDRGQVDAVVRVLPGFARDVERGRTTSVQVLLDGTNSNTASHRLRLRRPDHRALFERGDAAAAARENGGRHRWLRAARSHAAVPQVDSRSRVWFNPDLRSRNYFIPGVIVNIITLVTLSLTAMAIVREKEIGTMEQLMVTPIRPVGADPRQDAAVRAGGLLGHAAGDGRGAADLPRSVPRQLLAAVAWRTLLFLLTTWARACSSPPFRRTQQQAMMATGLFFQPFFMLSGFTFPIRNMPHGGAVADVLESGALLHGDRARRVPARARASTRCGRRWSRWRFSA